MKALNEILDRFGFATLVDVHIYKLAEGKKYGQVLDVDDFELYAVLDTLKICNLKEKGAKHIYKAGEFNVPIRRVGNTITMEIKDALGKFNTLQTFFNLQVKGTHLYRSSIFSSPFAIEGKTQIVNTKGELNNIYIFIPCFIPNGALEVQTTIEQDFGVFDLSGEIYPIFLDTMEPHIEWYSLCPYSIKDQKWKDQNYFIKNHNEVIIKHSFAEPTQVEKDSYIYNKDIVEMKPMLTDPPPVLEDEEEVVIEQTYDAVNEYYNSFIMDGDKVQIDLNNE